MFVSLFGWAITQNRVQNYKNILNVHAYAYML